MFEGYLQPRGFLNKSRKIVSYFSYCLTCKKWHLYIINNIQTCSSTVGNRFASRFERGVSAHQHDQTTAGEGGQRRAGRRGALLTPVPRGPHQYGVGPAQLLQTTVHRLRLYRRGPLRVSLVTQLQALLPQSL